MSAGTLRRAAALMRERADAATPGPWDRHMHSPDMGGRHGYDLRGPRTLGPEGMVLSARLSSANAEHIASWHPAVALAVADWLDDIARWTDFGDNGGARNMTHALTVARTYLGEQS